jgi:hypothetical protein
MAVEPGAHPTEDYATGKMIKLAEFLNLAELQRMKKPKVS